VLADRLLEPGSGRDLGSDLAGDLGGDLSSTDRSGR
jgi:hypothetical protein